MPEHIKINLAGLNIDAEYKSGVIAKLCRDYVSDFDVPDISVFYDEKGCAAEAKKSGHGEASAEFANIYRQIAEKLPLFSRVVAHGAAISYKERGYLFIAKSGTGKTTHIKLWKEFFEGVDIINGDKPILEITGDGVTAYGTPWAGKEMFQKNTSKTLGGICLIRRAENNSIRRLEGSEAINAIIKQIYMPQNGETLDLTIRLIDDIIRFVPFYELSCNISREAAVCSFTALTGEKI